MKHYIIKEVSVYRNIDTWTSTGTDKKTTFTSEEVKSCPKIPICKKKIWKIEVRNCFNLNKIHIPGNNEILPGITLLIINCY